MPSLSIKAAYNVLPYWFLQTTLHFDFACLMIVYETDKIVDTRHTGETTASRLLFSSLLLFMQNVHGRDLQRYLLLLSPVCFVYLLGYFQCISCLIVQSFDK